MLDIKCSFLEESAVSPTIMVNHLPETVSEISLTNLSVITSMNSLHLTRRIKLSPFFVSHKECAGCRQCWWITQQPAPLLDSPSQTSQTNGLIAQVPIFLFLVGSSNSCLSSGSLGHLTLFVAVWRIPAVSQWHKAAQCFLNLSSISFELGKLCVKTFGYLFKWSLHLKAMQEQKQSVAISPRIM